MNDETINDKDANIPIMICNIYVTIHVRLLFCVLHFILEKLQKTQYKVNIPFNFHLFGTPNELELNIF